MWMDGSRFLKKLNLLNRGKFSNFSIFYHTSFFHKMEWIQERLLYFYEDKREQIFVKFSHNSNNCHLWSGCRPNSVKNPSWTSFLSSLRFLIWIFFYSTYCMRRPIYIYVVKTRHHYFQLFICIFFWPNANWNQKFWYCFCKSLVLSIGLI